MRTVLALIKTVRDLERVGDEAKKIAKLALKLTEEGPSPRGYHELRQSDVAGFAERAEALSSARRLELAGILAEPLQVPPEQAEQRINGIARGLLGPT